MKQATYFDDTDYRWIVGGLVTALGGLILFIKDLATRLFATHHNNNEKRLVAVEQRLVAVEQGLVSVRQDQALLMSKITEVNHKIDNQDVAEAGAFTAILEELKELRKK